MSGSLTADGLAAMMRSLPRAPPAMQFVQVPTWVYEERWVNIRPKKVPPKDGRWGTRKLWKRRFNRRTWWQLRVIPIEPDHVIKTADGTVYCTARQYAAIKASAL